MTAITGNAIRLQLDLQALQQKRGLAPVPFTPIPLRPAVDYDIMLEGYASPATVDREFMKFAPNCWTPFKPDIPLLFRHSADQPAGRIDSIRVDDKGLYVRARVSHAEAKRCPYFSVAATIHAWQIREAPVHGLITSATLDDVSLIPSSPGNPDAIASRPPPPIEFYDHARAAINKMIQIVEVLQKLAREQPDVSQVKHHRLEDRSTLTLGPAAGHIYGPIPERPVRHARSPTQFSALVQQMQEMS